MAPGEIKPGNETLCCLVSPPNGGHAGPGCAKVALRATTSFRGRIAESGPNVPFGFETIERGINGPNGHIASGPRFQFPADGDTIRLLRETQKRCQNYEFETAEAVVLLHYIYNVHQIGDL
jgi:hypothetical protein